MVQLLRAKKLQECLYWLWRSIHLFKALQGVFWVFQGFIGLSPQGMQKKPNPNKIKQNNKKPKSCQPEEGKNSKKITAK